jgi:serine/threonine protein kinase
LDARVDVFALGVIVYELFTGRRPFSNRPIDMICRNHQAPIFASPIWEDLPGDLRVVVANMLSLEPERRPVDAAETLHRLREAAGHLAIGPDQLQREPQAAATIGRIRSFKSNASGPRSAFRSSRRRIAWFGASLCSALFAAFMVGPHFRQGAAHSWAAARLQRSSSTIFANTSTDPDWDQGRHDMHVPLENDIPAVDSGASNQKDGTIPISKHVQPASTQSRSARPSKPSGPFFDPGSFR